MIMFFGTLDSVTIAHRDALLAAAYRLSATKPERAQAAGDRVNYLRNLGRPDEAAKWVDTLATLDRNAAGLTSLLGAYWFGGGPADTTIMDEPDTRNSWLTWRGDAAAGQRLLASWRGLAAKDSTDGFPGRGAAILEAKLALDRRDPAAARLTDLADSLWVGREGGSVWASFELARLYERQGRVRPGAPRGPAALDSDGRAGAGRPGGVLPAGGQARGAGRRQGRRDQGVPELSEAASGPRALAGPAGGQREGRA